MSDPSQPEVVSPDEVSPEAARSGGPSGPGGERGPESDDSDAGELEIESPAKIIRIGGMVKQLLDEVRNTSLDEAAREQLRDIYDNSLAELRTALSPELGAELDRLALDFDDETVPSEAQLRIAKAQLVGWLEGLFHGIQATLVAQQMAARSQLQVMRGQLPVGPGGPGGDGQRVDGPPSTGLGYI